MTCSRRVRKKSSLSLPMRLAPSSLKQFSASMMVSLIMYSSLLWILMRFSISESCSSATNFSVSPRNSYNSFRNCAFPFSSLKQASSVSRSHWNSDPLRRSMRGFFDYSCLAWLLQVQNSQRQLISLRQRRQSLSSARKANCRSANRSFQLSLRSSSMFMGRSKCPITRISSCTSRFTSLFSMLFIVFVFSISTKDLGTAKLEVMWRASRRPSSRTPLSSSSSGGKSSSCLMRGCANNWGREDCSFLAVSFSKRSENLRWPLRRSICMQWQQSSSSAFRTQFRTMAFFSVRLRGPSVLIDDILFLNLLFSIRLRRFRFRFWSRSLFMESQRTGVSLRNLEKMRSRRGLLILRMSILVSVWNLLNQRAMQMWWLRNRPATCFRFQRYCVKMQMFSLIISLHFPSYCALYYRFTKDDSRQRSERKLAKLLIPRKRYYSPSYPPPPPSPMISRMIMLSPRRIDSHFSPSRCLISPSRVIPSLTSISWLASCTCRSNCWSSNCTHRQKMAAKNALEFRTQTSVMALAMIFHLPSNTSIASSFHRLRLALTSQVSFTSSKLFHSLPTRHSNLRRRMSLKGRLSCCGDSPRTSWERTSRQLILVRDWAKRFLVELRMSRCRQEDSFRQNFQLCPSRSAGPTDAKQLFRSPKLTSRSTMSCKAAGFSLKRIKSSQVAKRRLLLLSASLGRAYSPRSSKMPLRKRFRFMPRLLVDVLNRGFPDAISNTDCAMFLTPKISIWLLPLFRISSRQTSMSWLKMHVSPSLTRRINDSISFSPSISFGAPIGVLCCMEADCCEVLLLSLLVQLTRDSELDYCLGSGALQTLQVIQYFRNSYFSYSTEAGKVRSSIAAESSPSLY